MRAPIGIFDSGVGGLSVAREIHRRLPGESLLYLADTAHVPYGGRPLEEIRALSMGAAGELVRRGAKIIVVACNTASGAALEALRDRLEVPVVGLEPAVKPAAASTRAGRIGVMATEATLRTERFQRLLRDYAAGAHVVTQPCPGLVELVESGELEGDRVRETLDQLTRPLRAAGVDVVVLGCTHYPFLRGAIEESLGDGVRVIDSGEAVARQVERVLTETGARAGEGVGEVRVLATGALEPVRRVVERLWEGRIDGYDQVSSSGAPSGASAR